MVTLDQARTVARAGTDLFRRKGIRWISFAQGTIAAIAGTTGLIPDRHLKYYMGASALLSFWHGFLKDHSDDT